MHRKYLPLVLLLVSFLLFACGSPNTTSDNNDQPMEVQQEQAVPTETALMPREAAGTEQPQPTPTIEVVTKAPAEVQMDTESLCYHPYFPIIDGAFWTFDVFDDVDYTLRIEETGEDTFTMIQEMEDEDITYSVDWYCSDQGILRGSFGQVDLINQAAGGDETPEFVFETLEWEGETLPAPELINLGYSWHSDYKLSTELNIEGISQRSELMVTIEHEIGAMEAVTVPAGTFSEALRVDSLGQIDMVLFMGESSLPFSGFEFEFSTWYVEGLGMVKTSSEVSGSTTGVSLFNSSLLD